MGEGSEVRDKGRALWLQERRSGLGGSDAAAILGLSRWATEIDVWMAKTGLAPERGETEAMWWGSAVEEIVARRYVEKTGRKLWNPERVFRHPEREFLVGTPDRLVLGAKLGVEVKTASIYSAADWGREGSDEIPPAYVIQCCHYLALTGFPVWDVAVLIGGADFRIYRVVRDVEFEREFVERLSDWWDRHVIRGERPGFDGSEGSGRYLAARFPKAEERTIIEAPVEAEEHVARIEQAKTAVKTWEEERALRENLLKELIGPADGMSGAAGDWLATWKNVAGRKQVDWEKVARALADLLSEKAGIELGVRALQAAEAQFADEAPGARRFVLKRRGGTRP